MVQLPTCEFSGVGVSFSRRRHLPGTLLLPQSSSFSLSISSLELGDRTMYEPHMRARLGTNAHFCKVVLLQVRVVPVWYSCQSKSSLVGVFHSADDVIFPVRFFCLSLDDLIVFTQTVDGVHRGRFLCRIFGRSIYSISVYPMLFYDD